MVNFDDAVIDGRTSVAEILEYWGRHRGSALTREQISGGRSCCREYLLERATPSYIMMQLSFASSPALSTWQEPSEGERTDDTKVRMPPFT